MTLTELQQAVIHLFPAAGPSGGSNWAASTDSSGNASISRWNTALGAEPTSTQLTDSYNSSTLLIAQQQQTASLRKSYETARYGTPVSLTSGSTTLSFPTDTATQNNIADYLTYFSACTATGATPMASVPLQDASGTVQSLTLAQLQQLAVAITNQSVGAYDTLVSLCAKVAAATTVSAVQTVVWSS